MPIHPVERSSVSDQVFARLRDSVLTGEYPPDTTLPAERHLAEAFGVNRHAIREALKRMQQAQLVEISHGGATRVRDWRTSAGLDLAVHLAQAGDVLPVRSLLRDMLEMRACVGADAARLCAERADDPTRAAIRLAARHFAEAGPDLDKRGAANIALWRRIIIGSGNVAYLLAFNSLVAHAYAIAPVPTAHRAGELLDTAGHLHLAELIADGRPDDAERLARHLLTRSVAAVLPADERSH
jgi:GntR family transcriptional repressor for pyruvate dehydrogenase complex